MRRLLPTLLTTLILATAPALVQAQARGLPNFTELAENHSPSVINISITKTTKLSRRQGLPFDENDPAFELFRRFMPQIPNAPREQERKSLGSGFIISSDGYILTNAHVVDGADEILVRLTDQKEFQAEIIGSDKRTDVALIKIDARNLPAVNLGDPSRLKVGEWVLAIGSPFGFESTVTAGIVSAKGRSLPQENYVPFIQTDVPINPGNSGGPLFNMNGEVIGINSQIYSRSGGYQGLSFAIPINVAMDVQRQLRSKGHVTRGRIGVVIQNMTQELARSFGLKTSEGAIINQVVPDGPASQAGIRAGDIVLSFNGSPVKKSSDLPRLVAATVPKSKAKVTLWRQGARKNVYITVGELKDKQQARILKKGNKKSKISANNRIGLGLSVLDANQKNKLGLQGGLVIRNIQASKSKADLRVGDIIIALIHKGMSTTLSSVGQFNSLLNKINSAENITLLIRRNNSQSFVTIPGNRSQ